MRPQEGCEAVRTLRRADFVLNRIFVLDRACSPDGRSFATAHAPAPGGPTTVLAKLEVFYCQSSSDAFEHCAKTRQPPSAKLDPTTPGTGVVSARMSPLMLRSRFSDGAPSTNTSPTFPTLQFLPNSPWRSWAWLLCPKRRRLGDEMGSWQSTSNTCTASLKSCVQLRWSEV